MLSVYLTCMYESSCICYYLKIKKENYLKERSERRHKAEQERKIIEAARLAASQIQNKHTSENNVTFNEEKEDKKVDADALIASPNSNLLSNHSAHIYEGNEQKESITASTKYSHDYHQEANNITDTSNNNYHSAKELSDYEESGRNEVQYEREIITDVANEAVVHNTIVGALDSYSRLSVRELRDKKRSIIESSTASSKHEKNMILALKLEEEEKVETSSSIMLEGETKEGGSAGDEVYIESEVKELVNTFVKPVSNLDASEKENVEYDGTDEELEPLTRIHRGKIPFILFIERYFT
jgi:hypothetical protein